MQRAIPFWVIYIFLFATTLCWSGEFSTRYGQVATECIKTLVQHGTDRYGPQSAPILVSILDSRTLDCPADPEPYDEYFRVTRRERRNPAGANLLFDLPLLKTMMSMSKITSDDSYSTFVQNCVVYYLNHFVDDKGLFWWGWHRHVDVYTEEMTGHSGKHHEIHAIHAIDWELLWQIDRQAVTREIEAIWQWHVIDKTTGEINRHGNGKAGCDFSMSAGAVMEAFAFLYTKTNDPAWLERTHLIADYYWQHRHPETDLFPERPNAGQDRFDGSSFVTSITGSYCHSLFRVYEYTGQERFRDQANALLSAYANMGFDQQSGKFWGALQLDGTPIPGPRIYTENLDSAEGYAAAQPRGFLDLWEPYIAGYQYPIYTAQNYANAFRITGNELFLDRAKRFADWIERVPPGSPETEQSWYQEYSNGPGRQGTYAGKYGRTISFFLQLYALANEQRYFDSARTLADEAIEKLYANGLLKGHPAKPYYEAVDGVGYLLYALIQLDQVIEMTNNSEQRQQAFKMSDLRIVLDNW